MSEFIIRTDNSESTAAYLVEARTGSSSWRALLPGRHAPNWRMELSIHIDHARRFATAGLAASYIERIAGTADGFQIVPIAPR